MIEKLEEIFIKEENIKSKKLQDYYKSKLEAFDYVSLARHEKRPKVKEFIENIIDESFYFSGDRYFSDDKSLIGGIGYFEGIPVTFLGTNKGINLEENLEYNFGMLKPEGYRKALRLMKEAEKFNRPILTFIDTPGAYPGVDAEKRGQGEAIARNLMEMGSIKTPIISIFTGEGGSGGALALSVSDRIIMMEFSIFSILSPEGFASILWKDKNKYKEATEYMKLTSKDLKEFKIIDSIVYEDICFSKSSYNSNYYNLKKEIKKNLDILIKKDTEELLDERFEKYRQIGVE